MESWIDHCEREFFDHPIDLIPGVRDTLPILQSMNTLILVSKGVPEEQLGKLQRSGLAHFFMRTEIVFEKDAATYRDLVRLHQLQPESTWMIGNSPRSDINPAKAAGLRTVFIPYHTTWWHEIEEITPDGRDSGAGEFLGNWRIILEDRHLPLRPSLKPQACSQLQI